MGLWSKLTGGQTATPASRTAADRRRTAREISQIDARTTAWLRCGGLAPRKGER